MPSITIDYYGINTEKRKKLARELCIVLGKAGVNISHVLIIFREVSASDVFAGPIQFSQTLQGDGSQAFCQLTLECLQSRSDGWKSIQLKNIASLLGKYLCPNSVFIRIVPVARENYWNEKITGRE